MFKKFKNLFINNNNQSNDTYCIEVSTEPTQQPQTSPPLCEYDVNTFTTNKARLELIKLVKESVDAYPPTRPFFNALSDESQSLELKKVSQAIRARIRRTNEGTIFGALKDDQIRMLFYKYKWELKDAVRFEGECLPKLRLSEDIVDDYIKDGSLKLKDACYLLADLDPIVYGCLEENMDDFLLDRFENIKSQLSTILNETDLTSNDKTQMEDQINLIDLANIVRISSFEVSSILSNKLKELINNDETEIKKVICREIEVLKSLLKFRKISDDEYIVKRNNLVELLSIVIKSNNIALSRRKMDIKVSTYIKENTSLFIRDDFARSRMEVIDRLINSRGDKINLFIKYKDIHKNIIETIPAMQEKIPSLSVSIESDNVINFSIKPYASSHAEPFG